MNLKRVFLRFLLRFPERLEELRSLHRNNPEVVLPHFESATIARVIKILLCPENMNDGKTGAAIKHRLLDEFYLRDDPDLHAIIAESAFSEFGVAEPPALLSELLDQLMKQVRKRKAAAINLKIRNAEEIGDDKDRERWQFELIQLLRDTSIRPRENLNG